jgi:hypothetical protein
MRIAMNVFMRNDGDSVDVILLYFRFNTDAYYPVSCPPSAVTHVYLLKLV